MGDSSGWILDCGLVGSVSHKVSSSLICGWRCDTRIIRVKRLGNHGENVFEQKLRMKLSEVLFHQILNLCYFLGFVLHYRERVVRRVATCYRVHLLFLFSHSLNKRHCIFDFVRGLTLRLEIVIWQSVQLVFLFDPLRYLVRIVLVLPRISRRCGCSLMLKAHLIILLKRLLRCVTLFCRVADLPRGYDYWFVIQMRLDGL